MADYLHRAVEVELVSSEQVELVLVLLLVRLELGGRPHHQPGRLPPGPVQPRHQPAPANLAI